MNLYSFESSMKWPFLDIFTLRGHKFWNSIDAKKPSKNFALCFTNFSDRRDLPTPLFLNAKCFMHYKLLARTSST